MGWDICQLPGKHNQRYQEVKDSGKYENLLQLDSQDCRLVVYLQAFSDSDRMFPGNDAKNRTILWI